MWGFEHWVAVRWVARGAALGALCCVAAMPLAAQQQRPASQSAPAGQAQPAPAQAAPAKPQGQAAQPTQQAATRKARKPGEPSELDVCYGMTGASAEGKIEACTDVIDNGLASGGALAMPTCTSTVVSPTSTRAIMPKPSRTMTRP